MCRRKLATWARPPAGLGTGQSSPAGNPNSLTTIRIGSTRSVSLERTAAASKFPQNASRTRWQPRFTSLPFSSDFQTFATSGNGGVKCGAIPPRICGGCTSPAQCLVTRKLPRCRLPRSGAIPTVLRARDKSAGAPARMNRNARRFWRYSNEQSVSGFGPGEVPWIEL